MAVTLPVKASLAAYHCPFASRLEVAQYASGRLHFVYNDALFHVSNTTQWPKENHETLRQDKLGLVCQWPDRMQAWHSRLMLTRIIRRTVIKAAEGACGVEPASGNNVCKFLCGRLKLATCTGTMVRAPLSSPVACSLRSLVSSE